MSFLGELRPLVQAPSEHYRGRALTQLSMLAAGFVLSATMVTIGSARIGMITRDHLSQPRRTVLAIILLTVLFELTRSRPNVFGPFIKRQTPQRFHRWNSLGTFLWGFDTGLMLTTVRVTLLTFAGLGLVLLGFGSGWVGIGYGLGFTLPLILTTVLGPKISTDTVTRYLLSRLEAIRRVALALTLAMIVWLVLSMTSESGALPAVRTASKAILIAVWALAAVSKISSFEAFVRTIRSIGVSSRARHVARLVVTAEVVTAILLALPSATVVGVLMTLGLAGAFAFVGTYALVSHKHVLCSCFGASDAVLGWRQVGLLPLLSALSALALQDPVHYSALSAYLMLVGGLAAASMAALILLVNPWEAVIRQRHRFENAVQSPVD